MGSDVIWFNVPYLPISIPSTGLILLLTVCSASSNWQVILIMPAEEVVAKRVSAWPTPNDCQAHWEASWYGSQLGLLRGLAPAAGISKNGAKHEMNILEVASAPIGLWFGNSSLQYHTENVFTSSGLAKLNTAGG